MAKTEKPDCGICGEPATQVFITGGGHVYERGGAETIARCDVHAVPANDVGSSWFTPEQLDEITKKGGKK